MTLDVPCWSCGVGRAPTDALCPKCGKVQPPPARRQGEPLFLDKFATLGVPRSWALETPALEDRFRLLQRKLHPDRFVRAGPQERRFALEQTTLLNDAYRTLKDPARRAEHLLELRGIHLAGEAPQHAHGLPVVKVEMSPEFLEEMMEDRERLLEARMEGGPLAVAPLAAGVKQKRDATLARVGTLLRALESCEPAEEKRAAVEAAEQVARLRYYARYLDEVEGKGPEV